ncbi:hypothetical protein ACM55M_10675 [Flavobacterium sp. ZT3R25]|uniref:hypothetical protein n=1 Tax=Flavobacterium galactosi TaxID=3398735 RepID=UPI003A89DA9F
MIIINDGEVGLGKSKFLRRIRLKDVSLKNAVKVAKFAAPIAAGFIPVGGGVASKLLSSKAGRLVSKVAKSKAVTKAVKLSKTAVGKQVVSSVKNRSRPQLQTINNITPASFAKSELENDQNQNTESSSYQSEVSKNVEIEKEPVGELTPIKPIEQKPKDNTILYVAGAVVLGGGIYLATKK